jgi:hypothetical protein
MARRRRTRKVITIAPPQIISVGRRHYRYKTAYMTKEQAQKFRRRARRMGYGVRIRKVKARAYAVYTRG